MENFELSKEVLQKANTYMSLAQKTILAELVARRSVKPIRGLATEKESKEQSAFIAIPSVVGEDSDMKEKLLLNVLLSHYLDIAVPEMDNNIYDFYMGGHLLNQLERFKTDSELKIKAFDILADFKQFKKMVDIEIYNIKTKENDVVERTLKGVSLFAAEKITENPELIDKFTDELKKAVENLKVQEPVAAAEGVEE